jgi:predicted transcriptional regulator
MCVMSREVTQNKAITLRLTGRLRDDLERAAHTESNTTSAVARRLLAQGLARERRQQDREDAELERR